MSSKQPSTIEELRQWYKDRKLPPENVTRFFIGKNIREPKAFGIYKDENGECVVYKNKANGERAVRYQGRDEAFAVGELLNRLKEEILLRKGKNPTATSPISNAVRSNPKAIIESDNNQTYKRRKYKGSKKNNTAQDLSFTPKEKRQGCFLVGIVGAIMAFFVYLFGGGVPNGYYQYNDKFYYHLGSAWYLYDALASQWAPTESLDEWITEDNAEQYSTSSFSGKPFEETGWYEDYYTSNSSDDDNDSSYDWDDDNDSWDSDDTNWDDDW